MGGDGDSESGKKVPTQKAAKRIVEDELGLLPRKALVLTDAEGRIAGVLPKQALVLVKRGIAKEGGITRVGT